MKDTLAETKAARDVIERLAMGAAKPVCAALCDAHGHLCFFIRMPGAAARGINIAIGKAYTAAIMECRTSFLQERLKKENLTLTDFCDSRFTSMPGGVPLQAEGKTFGGIGLSGLSPILDEELALNIAREILK